MDSKYFTSEAEVSVTSDPVPLDAAWIEQLKSTFALFDDAKTGHIRATDLGTVIRGLGKNITEKQLAQLVNDVSVDSNGMIDFADFVCLMGKHQLPNAPTPAEIESALKIWDTESTGHIDAAEFVHMLRNMGEPLTEEDVHNLMQEIQFDGDKKINVAELVRHFFETSAPGHLVERGLQTGVRTVV